MDERTLPDLSPYIRDGDTVLWGQAAAEPLTLTRALVAQRQSWRSLNVFQGIPLSDTLKPDHVALRRWHFRDRVRRCRPVGLSIARRKLRMLDIAHPSQREMLERESAYT